jgi:hypothetical protein
MAIAHGREREANRSLDQCHTAFGGPPTKLGQRRLAALGELLVDLLMALACGTRQSPARPTPPF